MHSISRMYFLCFHIFGLLLQLWSTPSRLEFQLTNFGGNTNIGIDYRRIDGPFNSIGTGQSPNYGSPGYSFLTLDTSETWKLRAQDPSRGKKYCIQSSHEKVVTLRELCCSYLHLLAVNVFETKVGKK